MRNWAWVDLEEEEMIQDLVVPEETVPPNRVEALLSKLNRFIKSCLESRVKLWSSAESHQFRRSQPSYASTERGRPLVNPVSEEREASLEQALMRV